METKKETLETKKETLETKKETLETKKETLETKRETLETKKETFGDIGNNWRQKRRQKRRHWETQAGETIFEDMREKRS